MPVFNTLGGLHFKDSISFAVFIYAEVVPHTAEDGVFREEIAPSFVEVVRTVAIGRGDQIHAVRLPHILGLFRLDGLTGNEMCIRDRSTAGAQWQEGEADGLRSYVCKLSLIHILRDPTMAAATLVGAQADAMKAAASNEAGAMTGFMGMGMAMNAGGGMNAQNLFAMGQQQQPQPAVQQPQNGSGMEQWKCACGNMVSGKFCPECGSPKPVDTDGWTCSCGAVNKGKFCQNCGAKKPEGAPLYRCDKCGWQPEDPKNPPKFCPECGDIFDDSDKQ